MGRCSVAVGPWHTHQTSCTEVLGQIQQLTTAPRVRPLGPSPGKWMPPYTREFCTRHRQSHSSTSAVTDGKATAGQQQCWIACGQHTCSTPAADCRPAPVLSGRQRHSSTPTAAGSTAVPRATAGQHQSWQQQAATASAAQAGTHKAQTHRDLDGDVAERGELP